MSVLEENSIDSIITDPPYGLSFMGKEWDHGIPGTLFWVEALRVAKPGAYLLAFGGTRTFHWLTCAIEDAGWEIRDCIMWVYGSGFPKSLNVGKAVDKLQGNEREVIGKSNRHNSAQFGGEKYGKYKGGLPNETKGASAWEGWGTALKPAWEPIIIARKPVEGTVAENVLKYGTGGMNIDGCRVEINPDIDDPRLGGKGDWSSDKMAKNVYEGGYEGKRVGSSELGRFPANFIHDGSDEVVELFPTTVSRPRTVCNRRTNSNHEYGFKSDAFSPHCDSVSAARFFYCAKASKKDRDEGLDKETNSIAINTGNAHNVAPLGRETKYKNNHPTVKPTELMKYLCRLVTQPNGIILDPFMGSGSTGKAAVLEGFNFIGIELDPNYCEIAKRRINNVLNKETNLGGFSIMKLSERREEAVKKLEEVQKRNYETRNDSGRFQGFLRPDVEIPLWNCKPDFHEIDLIPYITGKNSPTLPPDEITYVCIVYVHDNVGLTDAQFVCPSRNYKKKCPICEEQKRLLEQEGMEWKQVSHLSPKKKTIYNIWCFDSQEEMDKGVQVWVTGFRNMEENLLELAQQTPRGGGAINFPNPDTGKTIGFKREGTKLEDTRYKGHRFLDRDYKIPNEILDQAFCLDDLLHISSYEEIYEAFYGEPYVEEKKETVDNGMNRVRRSVEERKENPPASTQTPPRKPREMLSQKQTSASTPTTKVSEEDVGPMCPEGGDYGKDCEKLDSCGNCPIYDDCKSEMDRVESDAALRMRDRMEKRRLRP
jgi:site-specific DNA-methyltransferase (adenine-specific)